MAATGRILVVDDELFFQELFRDLLRAAGHDVRSAPSGTDALARLGEEHFDLLVTDMVMPGIDGVALVRRRRSGIRTSRRSPSPATTTCGSR